LQNPRNSYFSARESLTNLTCYINDRRAPARLALATKTGFIQVSLNKS